MRPLEDWDEEYVTTEVPQLEESACLEIKASGMFSLTSRGQPDGHMKEELAKQVSAFSNAGDGFLVFGIDDRAKSLDAGVPITIGHQPVKDWIEAHIPNLVYPPVTQCECKVIQVRPMHAPDRGLVVISIPLSERRPHWVLTAGEQAYIRAGAHSLPMRPQTLLDISSRVGTSSTEILDLEEARFLGQQGTVAAYSFEVFVRLLNGPICEKWAFEMAVQSGPVEIGLNPQDMGKSLFLLGQEPLFPSRRTRVSARSICLRQEKDRKEGTIEILAVLYTGSAWPARRTFGLRDLDPMLKQLISGSGAGLLDEDE
jgi:hypothetical protein